MHYIKIKLAQIEVNQLYLIKINLYCIHKSDNLYFKTSFHFLSYFAFKFLNILCSLGKHLQLLLTYHLLLTDADDASLYLTIWIQINPLEAA